MKTLINIDVSGLQAASAFYQAALDLTQSRVLDDDVVDDLAAAAERATRAGAKQASECVAWRGSRCITFSDPFGHGFCLIEFDGETYR